MKKIILSVLLIVLTVDAFCQNIFPASGNVGIGTTTPNNTLQVTSGGGTGTGIQVGSYTGIGVTHSDGAAFFGNNVIESKSSNAILVTNTSSVLGAAAMKIGGTLNQAFIFYGVPPSVTAGSILNNELMRLTYSGNLGIGTTSPQSKLAVNGTVTAKQVKVTQTGWPDYVFDTAYSLSSLEKTAAYIQANKHLPGIPSAGEIRHEGLDLGDMQKKQMRKIEELTLYAIAREKQLQSQQQLIAQLTEALHQQEIRIRKLEKKLEE